MKISAIEIALNNELREQEFYTKNAQRTTSPLGKAMFEQLAKEEEGHYQVLTRLYQVWKANEKWPEEIPLVVGKTNVRNILLEYLRKIDTRERSEISDLEAVEVAISFEEKGVELYESLAREVEDEKEKAFFSLLASMEREHMLSLKDTLEYFKDPQSYFTRVERQILDGA